MSDQIIVIEDDSLGKAREQLHADNYVVLQETVLRPERVETLEGIAETVKGAALEVRRRMPVGAIIEKKKVKVPPERTKLEIKAIDKDDAVDKIDLKPHQVIEKVSLYRQGIKVFTFYITSDVYEVVLLQKAVVEIRYRERAKIQARVRDYSAAGLLQTVNEIRSQHIPWSEAVQLLNPKNIPETQNFLVKLGEFDSSVGLKAIESVCRQDNQISWQGAIKEAYYQGAIAVGERWKRLRGIDVDIASAFGFYIDIDWYEKSFKDPTGIPRYVSEYDDHHIPDPRQRKTIPYYSTDAKAFAEVEERAKIFGLYERYLELLIAEGLLESTATLEQKCLAMLRTRRPQKEREV